MSLDSRPPDFLSMTRGQLQIVLEKQISLKNCVSSKLPDAGKKLEESIARVKSILESQVYQLPLPIQSTRTRNCNLSCAAAPSPLNDMGSKREVDDNEDVDDLISGLVSLNLSPAKNDDAECEIDEDLSKLPESPLTSEELSDLQRLCNLPRFKKENASYHAFLFQLKTSSSGLVRLTVIDCRNSENHFIRHGVIPTWAIEDDPVPHHVSVPCDTVTTSPGLAVAEMWRFIRQGSAEDELVLVADCVGSLTRLRRLFCCPSVRHNTGARNALPRNIRFIVDSGAISGGKIYGSEEQLAESSISASLVARTLHYAKLDAATLAKLRPKTVAWIEAPLNLHALYAIAEMPRGPVVCHPPYVASPIPSNSSQQAMPESRPMLNSMNKSLLIRLAATGFNPSSLALLAGKAQWRGFAGLLAASHVSQCPDDLANLYCLCKRVYRGLALNTDLYREDASKPSYSPLWSSPLRQLKTLSMEESLKVMTRVRDEIKKGTMVEARSGLPPASALLLKYREQQAEESDDTLCADSDDD
ncbi:unnamed protein product [Hydatigera taeniaeformis]|uniref:Rhodanese domain-containing protein n=1 Tax=Hydatigena taeniaeformis TaxID=6205 RepID=A0A0R3X339_HYDTA|nr:unnamed protein product [Hydatigera taeniaeformis]